MRSRVRALLGRFLILALVLNGFLGLTPAPTLGAGAEKGNHR
jgi:hypothetical protein